MEMIDEAMNVSPEEEFLKAFDEYADGLFRHASFRVSDREKARDITQDTFLKAWDYARKGEKVGHWKGFFYRILNNLIVDEYRRRKEESLDMILEEEPGSGQELLSVGSRADTEELLDMRIRADAVRALLLKLPARDREVLTFRYLEESSLKEIAELLGITENVVSVRIHRAQKRLKELSERAHII